MDKLSAETFEAVVPDTGEVVSFKGRQLTLPGRVLPTGLELPEYLTYEQWSGIGAALQGVNRSLMWWIGDWLRYGERRWGEMYAQAIEDTGRAYDTLRVAQQVAAKFEFDRRRSNLSFKHHAEVLGMRPEEADELLDRAEEDRWSTRDLRAEVSRRKAARILGAPTAETCTVADLNTLVSRGLCFGTVYADPPWRYDNQGTRASTGKHYRGIEDKEGNETQPASGMTVEEICAMPVRELAAPDAHLHLWTTNGFLFECPRIFDAWGFEFRSSFVWVKSQIGIGNYWRNSHEFLLTAVRGDAKRFADKSLKSWLECDRSAHSAKPEQVRAFIERAGPGPRLELFARSPATGWTVWGNQIERGLLHRDVPEVA